MPFKVESPYEQWYYRRLKPWLHYLPVTKDLSNLESLFAWAEANPVLAQGVAERGRQAAKSIFSSDALLDAILDALVLYANIVKTRGLV